MALSDFSRAPLDYLKNRGQLCFHLLFGLPKLRRATRESNSWDELITLSFDFADGFIRPLQVRSEIRRALEAIEREQPRNVLEIGTARGGTFFLLSRAATADATLISIDLPGGRWGGGYSNWKTGVFSRFLRPQQTAHFVRENSHTERAKQQVKTLLNGKKLDLLFIDGDHSYEGVKADFLLYRDCVRPGGLIVLHDIAHHRADRECYVDRFWHEIDPGFDPQEIIEDVNQGWAGIGIARNY